MSLTDNTDWLPTPLAALTPLDAALRCQVCKDFFTTPMITSCSHTFCSICIRRSLSQDGRCPVCRELDQEMKLRRNWAVEEAVLHFTEAREGLLEFANTAAAAKAEVEDIETNRPKKRRKVNGGALQIPDKRSTRSQSRKTVQASQESVQSTRRDIINDSEGSGSEYEDENQQPIASKPATVEPSDGLVACPMCGRRMKEQAVYTHLDTCTGVSSEPASSPPPRSNSIQTGSIAYTLTKPCSQKDRLPTINYAILNENQLRKKLKDLGIPTLGNKILLQRRHTEWLNLWNANCDSRNPRPKNALVRELETWERTQGRQIAGSTGPTGVMIKDFDRDNYARSHKTDFDTLIEQARAKRLAKSAEGGPKSEPSGEQRTPRPVEEFFVPNANAPEADRSESVDRHVQAIEDGEEVQRRIVFDEPPNGLVDLTASPKIPSLEPTRSQGPVINV